MFKHAPQPIESWRGLIAVLCGKRVSVADLTILPFFVSGLMGTHGLTASQAGLIISLELTSLAIAAVVTSVYLAHIPVYRTTTLAIVIVATAQLLSAMTMHLPTFVLLRIICGFAAGIVGATITSTIASAKSPDRAAGMLLVAGGLSGLIIILPIVWANLRWGLSGVLTVVSLYCWITLLVIRWAPFANREWPAPTTAPSRWNGKALAIPVLLGFAVWAIGESALMAFVEPFGIAIKLEQARIGAVFSLLPIALLCGGGLCVVVGKRIGRTAPLAICIFSMGLIIGLFPRVETIAEFGALLLAWTFFSTFSVPYVYGLMAELDEHGRWVGLLAAASPIATGMGPFLGGLAMQSGSFGTLAFFVALAHIVIFVLLVPVSTRVPRTRPV